MKEFPGLRAFLWQRQLIWCWQRGALDFAAAGFRWPQSIQGITFYKITNVITISILRSKQFQVTSNTLYLPMLVSVQNRPCTVLTCFWHTRRTPQSLDRPTKDLSLVGCARLLIRCIRSYPPHSEARLPSATWGRPMPWWQTHLSRLLKV
jgi:hypothetical protein